MAQPRQKHSKASQRSRSANWKLKALNLTECPQCKHLRPSHQVCPNCGFYRGREVMQVE